MRPLCLPTRATWFTLLLMAHSVAVAGTFGTVVPIRGMASDIALDEKRGALYISNYTANRIEVLSTSTGQIGTSIPVPAQPSAIAVSRDGRYLAVAHASPFASTPTNAVTLVNLDTNARQTMATSAPALAIAFGADGKALITTTKEFVRLDPGIGMMTVLDTVQKVVSKALPVPTGTLPVEISHASLTCSGDGQWIYGLVDGGSSTFFMVRYLVATGALDVPAWTFSPPLGPLMVSPAYDGSSFMAGWALFTRGGVLIAETPEAVGNQVYGSHVFDSIRGTIYGQFPKAAGANTKSSKSRAAAPAEQPMLALMDTDNLTVREQLLLPEFLTGRSVLTADGSMMYSVSESGVVLLPVGTLSKSPRVTARVEDLLFRANFCDRNQMVQEIDVVNPGGGNTAFTVSTTMAGVSVSPQSAVTPAKISVAIDPGAFLSLKGTQVGTLNIQSGAAVNLINPVRILVNNREPDQRGTIVNVPGKLVDILADPARNRYYVLRQDKNLVLVFDAATHEQTTTLRTGTTPMRMAITFDRKYLLVGNDDSQIANVYDLDTLTASAPVVFPSGRYPRSIAVSAGSILAASRVAGPKHTMARIDMARRTATDFTSLGIFENDVNIDTVLSGSPSGGSILVAQPSGSALIYDAASDSFPVARSGLTGTNGAFAALSDNQFVIGSTLYDTALRPVRPLDSDAGAATSGIAAIDGAGLRTTSAGAASPGVIQRFEYTGTSAIRPTRMAEAPLTSSDAFIRTLAPLPNRQAIVSLTTSGITVLPWEYDAAVVVPHLNAVVNAADYTPAVASGSLISIFGQDLTPLTRATSEIPLPTALGDSCLTVNGVPVPLLFVSPTQINGQVPFNMSGSASMVLRTPGGVSNTLTFNVQETAPVVFQTQLAGIDGNLPIIVRAANSTVLTLSNPVHPDDWLTIYLTGLGATSPAVEAGAPAPQSPLAWAVAKPQVTLGGTPLELQYAGMSPGFAGLYQINAHVPSGGIPTGMEVPLTISQGGSSTSFKVRVVK